VLTARFLFLRTDWGLSSATLDGAGNGEGELGDYAYGETRINTGSTPTERLYTGQLGQTEIGLYYYNARWYAPYINRWVQPDSIVPDLYNPQALNRYSYVYNQPLRYTDPSGHCPVCIAIGAGIALIVWLAYPEPVYAPEPGWTPPANVDPNYGDRAYFDAAPGTGDLSDAYAAVTGRTLFTGEEVQGGARLMAVGATVLPSSPAQGLGRAGVSSRAWTTLFPDPQPRSAGSPASSATRSRTPFGVRLGISSSAPTRVSVVVCKYTIECRWSGRTFSRMLTPVACRILWVWIQPFIIRSAPCGPRSATSIPMPLHRT
jgi:RHS repeat-associated protein